MAEPGRPATVRADRSRRGRRRVFGLAVGIVLLWYAVPLVGAAFMLVLTWAAVPRSRPEGQCADCGAYDGIVLLIAQFLAASVVAALAVSVLLAAGMVAARFRNVTAVGNLAAVGGLAPLAIYVVLVWM
jgi:hypothetical protein